MIQYKISGIETIFTSKPENFRRDVNRWLQRNGLSIHTEINILNNDTSTQSMDLPIVDTHESNDSSQQSAISNPVESTIDLPKPKSRKKTL